MWKHPNAKDKLTVGHWKEVIKDLRWLMGPEGEICFTGGEPLLYNGILGLIRYASSLGFRTGLNTNAYLIDKSLAKEICQSRLWSITISLESHKESTHDFIRGMKGSYRKAIEAVDHLAALSVDLNIGLAAVITAANADDLVDLVSWVQDNPKIHALRLQALMQPLGTPKDPQWYANDRYNGLWPRDQEKVRSVIDVLIKLKEGGAYKLNNPVAQLRVFLKYFSDPSALPQAKKCIFQEDVININERGDLFLCPSVGIIGSALKENISTLWNSDKTTSIRQKIKECRESCDIVVNCFWE
jgi:MoaA/NifB/PqqE/SkfB family radical SAM enzyme